MASGGSETEIVSKQMSTGQKRFYFNLKQNDRGRFLKIAEVGSKGRNTIIIPDSGWEQFRDMMDSFIDGKATAGIEVPPAPAAAAPEVSSSGVQVWVEGLPWEITEVELVPYFSQIGPVERCSINRNYSGNSKGTAVVRYTDPAHAAAAIDSLDNTEVGETNRRKIHVRLDRYG